MGEGQVAKQHRGNTWGDDISDQRKAELEGMLQRWGSETNHGDRKGPLDGVKLTGADVFWLAARTLAGNGQAVSVSAQQRKLRERQAERNPFMPHNLGALHLEGANLAQAALQRADLGGAHLEGAYLPGAHLEGAVLTDAHFEDSMLLGGHLEGAALIGAHLGGAMLFGAHLEGAHLEGARLEDALLQEAHLEGCWLASAHLERTELKGAHLEGTEVAAPDLERIRAWVSDFPAELLPTDLRMAFFDSGTDFKDATLGDEVFGWVSLSDVRWGGANLAVVKWSWRSYADLLGPRIEPIRLGEDTEARMATDRTGKPKNTAAWLEGYEVAVRANRQLATTLRAQGMNDDADRFAYKAQKLQREVLRREGRRGAACYSWLLDLLAGYGYRPLRTLFWYLATIAGFALAYHALGPSVGVPLSPLGSLVFSVTSFHGRGFFPGGSPGHSVTLDDPLTVLAAAEAVVGLFIEVSFIATFTQRYFGK